MAPWIEKYRNVSNLKFLGHVDGLEKDRLLRTCWGLLNTSVHEAEPVSFLEAFSYGRCVISCHDPDNEVSNFGYYTGEVFGEGLDEDSLARFEKQIRKLLGNTVDRLAKGSAAREAMTKFHSMESFKVRLEEIFFEEGI
jgi:glycosyltransferase involved in cell wall biosynthesis